MGPRKSNAAALGKDDGAALGKMRKINPTGPNNTGSSSNSNANKRAITDFGLTSEECAFLEAQAALFNGGKNAGNGTTSSSSSTANSASSAGTDFAAMTKERWMAGLPLLISATEKLLHVAAEQYELTCKNRAAAAAAAAASRSAGGTSPTPGPSSNNAHEKDGSIDEMSRPTAGHGGNNLSIAEAALPVMNMNLPPPRPTPAAGTAAQFAEENAYIIAQAKQLQWYPFTYQRWVELLLDPGKYHTAKDEGRLRGDAIQASLRRCILVTYPAVEGGDCI